MTTEFGRRLTGGSFRREQLLKKVALYAVLVMAALVFLIPYMWTVSSSLKPEQDIFSRDMSLLPSSFEWQNYVDAWTDWPLGTWLKNSIIVAVIETFSVVFTAVLAGYAFARLRFWGRDTLFLMYLGAMMIPIQVTIIPSFVIITKLNLVDTYMGIASIRLVQFFGVFLIRQFFMNLPTELEDAARIDGCNRLRILVQIFIPLSGPALMALSIFAFTAAWNDFLWPLVAVTRAEVYTVQIGLATMKGEVIRWGPMLAATALSALPVLAMYLLLQRYFTQGIAMTGLKG